MLLIPSAIEADETDEPHSGLPGKGVSTTSIKVLSKGANGGNCKVEGTGEDSGRTKGKGVTAGENEEHCNIEGTGVPSQKKTVGISIKTSILDIQPRLFAQSVFLSLSNA